MARPARRITKALVEALKPSEIIWDAEVRGFGARCQKRDRVYVLKYRSAGQQRWFTIGKHGSPWTAEQARKEAKRLLGVIAAGQDPGKARAAHRRETMAELCDEFLAEHVSAKSKARTAAEYRRLIERIIKPELGPHNLSELAHSDLRKLHFKHRSTPYQANRIIAICSKMFSWSGRRGEANPCVGIERFAEEKRKRYLSASELKRLGGALREAEARNLISPFSLAAIRLLLFTGARLSEILTLRWTEVDQERACLQLRDSKTGAKTIHLSRAALEVLENLPRTSGNPFVICGQRDGSHLVNLQKAWRVVRELAGLGDLRLHDLRHSFASIGVGEGLGLPLLGGLLGHTQPATTARYAHLANDPLKTANELIGTRLSELLGADPPSPASKDSKHV
jgi:integrase